MGNVHAEIAGKPLRCGHCGLDVFRYEETGLETGRIGGLFVMTYACSGCGCLHLFTEADGAKHLRTESTTDLEPIECLSCGTKLPAGSQRCPACGWTWAVEAAEAPLSESL